MDLKRALIKIGEMESAWAKMILPTSPTSKMKMSKKITQGTILRQRQHVVIDVPLSTPLKGRGEKISGNPGEKIKGDSEADEKEEGGNGQGQDGDNGGDGGEEKTARIGPLHAGISHGNKPEFTVPMRSRPARALDATSDCHARPER